jgi:hypothetical protein
VFFLVNATYIALIFELMERTPADGAHDPARPLAHHALLRANSRRAAIANRMWPTLSFTHESG